MKQTKDVSVDEFTQEFRSVVDRIGIVPHELAHHRFVDALQIETQINLLGCVTRME
jgi:predicted Zn-dependent protease with MMP-like domain